MSMKNEPCSICEEWIDGVICDKDKCPVAIMKAEIERQKAEIERKGKILNSHALQYGTVTDQSKKIKEIKDEAIKEFAERLKDDCYIPYALWTIERVVDESDIDNLVKELTEKGGGSDA